MVFWSKFLISKGLGQTISSKYLMAKGLSVKYLYLNGLHTTFSLFGSQGREYLPFKTRIAD
jgi:hypothetical protein